MKCPECFHPQKVRREGMVCTKCQYRFVFNPKQSFRSLSDAGFRAILNSASSNGTYFFTANQLYVASLKFFKKKWFGYLILMVIFFVIGGGLLVAGVINGFVPLFVLAALFLLPALAIAIRGGPNYSKSQWDKVVAEWKKAGKSLDQLLGKPSLGTPPPNWQEQDIYDYGVEGLLICDKKRYVDLMVLNNFHTQNKMAVMSLGGYPEYLVPRVNELLDARADLPVYLVHDAHKKKGAMKKKLVSGSVFNIKNHPIRDLGLFDENVAKIRFLKSTQFATPDKVPLDAFLPKLLITSIGLSIMEGVYLGALLNETLAKKKDSDGGSYG